MQKTVWIGVILLLISVLGIKAQPATRFFNDADLMITGTFYYPEHWSESQWDRDLKNIADMGFKYVHMAEFAWAFLEPQEGKYDFTWLDRVVALAGKHGLKVMLCTPTATTPVWMGIKYPETFMMNSNYLRAEHGSRQNSSISNPKYQKLSFKVITEMAKHYGKNPLIMGWQLDNEPEAKEDYSPSAQTAFRKWLIIKYSTIEALNDAWGTAFWSMTYHSFNEIQIHNANSVGWWGSNQHALLDFKRFTADVQAQFLNDQAAILRKYIQPNQFITTNYVAVAGNADPRRADKLDFIAFTSYPNGGSGNLGENGFRMGNHTAIMQANDYFRPIKGVTGVMEMQPGQVNWGSVNSLLLPGVVRMWLWHNFAAGGRFASSYRYRQVNYSVEQYHAGMINPDGVTPSPGGREYIQFNAELKQLRALYQASASCPSVIKARSAAILWSHDNMWDQNRQPQTVQWNLWAHTLKYHQILKSAGAPVDYISETDDFSKYPILIVPAYQSVDSDLIQKFETYASNGGTLIITARTGVKNRDGHFWEAGWCAPIYNLIGASVDAFDMLPSWVKGTVSFDNQTYTWNNWADLLIPTSQTQVWGTYTNQFYEGKAAVVNRKVGKGSVTYVGVDTDDAQLEKQVIAKLYNEKGIAIENYPEGVFVEWRNGFMVAVNYSSTDYLLTIPATTKIILGERILKPAGVTVWME